MGLLAAVGVLAQEVPVDEVTAAFRQMIDIAPTIPTPSVVEVPLRGVWLERHDIAVLDQTTRAFIPTLFRQETQRLVTPLSITTSVEGSARVLLDNDPATYLHIDVPSEGKGSVEFVVTSAKPVVFSGLSTLLSPHVALPTHVEIRSSNGSGEKIVVARQSLTTSTVRFPATSATTWRITFTYGQPLRIAELKLLQDNLTTATTQSARFLAHPGHTYRLYLDADRLPDNVPKGEAGNLSSDIDVVKLTAPPLQTNPSYHVADSDGDGIPDTQDNCVAEPNADQVDKNENGRGDVCDDFDKDGVLNSHDNCPDQPNRSQADTDSDQQGDACDNEESRVTEANPWLIWLGLGLAALVVVGLFALTVQGMKKNNPTTRPESPRPVPSAQNHRETPADSVAGATPPDPEPK